MTQTEIKELEQTVLRPVTYEDYLTARRNKTMLEIELPSATLIVNPAYSMAGLYRDIQSVFCDLLCHDFNCFIEN